MSDAGDDQATRREGTGKVLRDVVKAIERGERIGRYVIEDPLGEGGMGVVYTAIDPELARKVAVKLVRPGGGAEAQARLLREAQAMAQLAHPNVVAIFDVGMYRQRVFLAMELIPGQTLRRWLRQQPPRRWREVLAVFLGAGRGLAAAHAAGILHRDFKLDNVLVDRQGRARVTDFGLARASDDAGQTDMTSSDSASPEGLDSLKSPLTVTGALMGTPAYMAPEQRLAAPPDARSDEFSFCVSLYEALYGERPFSAEGALREPSPNARVPTWIRRILIRGLASDPKERWPSMTALLDALSRDPAARRRRVALAAGLLGVAAVAVVAWPSRHAQTCEDAEIAFRNTWDDSRRAAVHAAFAKTGEPYAASVFDTTAGNLDRTAAAWKSVHDQACRATRVRHQQSEETMLLRMTCLERQRVELAALVDLLATADDQMVELAVQASGRLARPSECDDVRSLETTVKLPDDPKLRAEINRLRIDLATASALPNLGRPRDAIARLEPIAARAAAIGYRPLEAEAQFAMGLAYNGQGDYQASERAYKKAQLAAEAGRMDRLAAKTCTRLLIVVAIQSREEDALAWASRANAILERIGGDTAIEADVASGLATIEGHTGRHEQSVAHLKRAIELRVPLLGPEAYEVFTARVSLGSEYDSLARADEAIEQDSIALAGLERVVGANHPSRIVPMANLAQICVRVGRLAEAERLLERDLALARATVGTRSGKMAVVDLVFSELRLRQRRAREAREAAHEAAVIWQEVAGDKNDNFGDSLMHEGAAWLANGDAKAAIEALERGIAILEALNHDMPALADGLTPLGEALLAAGRPKQALPHLERALKLSELNPRYPADLARTRFATARALVASHGDRERAEVLAKQARNALAALPDRSEELAAVDAFLTHRR